MFNSLINRIPQSEPDLKIGSLSLWVSGYNDLSQMNQGDLAYLNTPTLLITEHVIVFSKNSDTPVFALKEFLKDLIKMYDNLNDSHFVELFSPDSEFSLKLATDNSGHIKIDIAYNSWTRDGRFEFEDMIDQSYLPSIFKALETILARFE